MTTLILYVLLIIISLKFHFNYSVSFKTLNKLAQKSLSLKLGRAKEFSQRENKTYS
jgi:hypothetical protein